MYLNNNHISEYGGVLVDYSVSGVEIKNTYYQKDMKLSLFKQKAGIKNVSIDLEFWGADRKEVTSKVSQFTMNLMGKLEIVLPDKFLYKGIVTSISEPVFPIENMAELKISIIGSQHLPLQTVELSNSGVITVDGTVETDCIIETLSAITIANFTINGINIFPLTANKMFIIDGINSKVTDNGANAIGKTDLINFPKLQPGENEITMSHPVTVTIKYYPTFM